MPKPSRWPNHANDARARAIQAAKQSVACIFKSIAAIGMGDYDAAIRHLTRVHELQVYIEATLMAAKYGEPSEPLPEEGVIDEA